MHRGDLVAGASVAGLMLPEAIAYAGIAGLPPQRAIIAGVVGCLTYALIGRSRFAIVSPTSSSAAIIAATLAAMQGTASEKAGLATVAVAFSGALFLIASAMRLGGLAAFISRPVLRGFAFGLAVTIIIRQLPVLAGLHLQAPGIFQITASLIASLPNVNLASVAVGGVAFVLLLALRRAPAIPGPFVVLAFGIAASQAFDLSSRGVDLVGPISLTTTWLWVPSPEWASYSKLLQFTPPLVLILFAESWGTIRALALRHGDTVEANRELSALGAANLASALAQGMPVGAGFSAGAASEAAGAQTRATAVIAALGLAILVLFSGGLVAELPEPVLAAVVVAALVRALDPRPMLRLWRLRRDQYVAAGAAAGVLLFGVLDGMLLAIALSLAAMIRRLSLPNLARLGRLDDSHTFVDVARHTDATEIPHLCIWRPTEALSFVNADAVLGTIARLARAEPGVHAVVISLEESADLDSTALELILEFDNAMSAVGFRVQYARVHDHVRDLLAAAGAHDLLSRSSYSVDDAVSAIELPMPVFRSLS